LSNGQRDAIKQALLDPARFSAPFDAPERLRRALARFNCQACHARDGYGGPTAGRADYFTSLNELDSGDEGRLPPHLEGVGRKLRADWLGEVLTNAGAVRPYLAVRMPQYGTTNVAALAADFIAADATPAVQETPPAGDVMAGAELVGLNGYSCISCHRFGPHPSLGIPVMDLTRMARRLHWDWFRRYLLEPAALRPGTRMPAFWPEGRASVTRILEGDPLRQIASIWSYLSLGGDAPPPPGLLESLEQVRGSTP
jgi:mono/diheme cytochrome c family protein